MDRSSREPVVEPPLPRHWAQAEVMDALHCRSCGYNLRGLRADGRCPECGLEIWASVLHTVDPAASRLPSLRNPAAVGNALVGLTVCMLAGMLLLLAPSIGGLIDAADRTGIWNWSSRLPTLTWGYAVVVGVLGLWAVRTLAPPRGAEPRGAVWKDLGRIAAGLVGWLAFACLWVGFQNAVGRLGLQQRLVLHLASAVFATIGLVGLRGVLDIIGRRSRAYRRSRGGRQSVELIIAAIVAGFIGALALYLANVGVLRRDWALLCRAVLWVSNFMVLIGLAYLVLNAWWIRRSLRRPPPPLDQVLAPQMPRDQWVRDREE